MDMLKYAKIADYIRSNSLAILGTIDDDGTPYGAVVYVCTDDHRDCQTLCVNSPGLLASRRADEPAAAWS
jgi:hypothetical protein